MDRSTMCAKCHCVLARDHEEPLCSPCAAKTGRARWQVSSSPAPRVTADDLDREGAVALAERLEIDPNTMVTLMFESGFLPGRMRRYGPHLARLLTLGHLSTSAAARELRVSRWTVAAWRERLAGTHAASPLEAPR